MADEKPVVYVVDDDPSVLESLKELLRPAGYEVKTFGSAFEFLDFRLQDAPSCLILEVNMPGIGGLDLQEKLGNEGILIPIIFITANGTVPVSVRAMKAGALDFMQKPLGSTDLLDSVSKAIAKDEKTRREQRELGKLRERLKTLTPREYEVLELVITGMLNKQIAYYLGTVEKTIKVHRARVFTKMAANSLADLVRLAEKLGIHAGAV